LGGYVATGAVGTAAYSNANAFATSNQGALADGALPKAATNGAEWGSHGGLVATNNTTYTQTVAKAGSAIQPAALGGYIATNSVGRFGVISEDQSTIIVSGAGSSDVNGTYTESGGYYQHSEGVKLIYKSSGVGNDTNYPTYTIREVIASPVTRYYTNSSAVSPVGAYYVGADGAGPAPTVEYLKVTNWIGDASKVNLTPGYVTTNGSGSSLTSLDLNPSLTATVAKAAAALTNITASQIVAAGGVTNVSTVGTPTSVVNLPTNNITKSVINTWPIGEGAMTLTNNTFLTFSGFATNDGGSWAMSITGTNTVTVDPTIIDGWGALVWTNSLTVPNDLFFRKTSGSMLIRVR
jgi:hypothetical protein